MSDHGATGAGPGVGQEMGDKAAEGVEHLQAAARELIEAARDFLDVAQQVVDDPRATESVVETLTGLARVVRRSATGAAEGRSAPYEHIDLD